MPRILTLLTIILLSNSIYAQTFSSYLRAGNDALDQKDYFSAKNYFSQANKIKKSPEVLYKLGISSSNIFDFELADKSFKTLSQLRQGDKYPRFNLEWAKVKMALEKYKDAKKLLTEFINDKNSNSEIDYAFALEKLNGLDNKQLLAKSKNTLKSVGKKINSDYSDFAAHSSGDTIYFSSLRYKVDKAGNKKDFITKIMSFKKGEPRARSVRYAFNSNEIHSANSALSSDKKTMYFTRCINLNATDKQCSIFYKSRKGSRWTKAQALPTSINAPGTSNTHPFIYTDEQRGREVLLFSSDRPSNRGGFNIWKSERPIGGLFSFPKTVQGINSNGNEITPFFQKSTGILFFSSDWYAGFGGYDIYALHPSAQKPIPLPKPINSSYNDLYFYLEANDTTGFIASNRPGSKTLDGSSCCNDIYAFDMATLDVPKEEPKEEIQPPPPPVEEPIIADAPNPTIELPKEKEPKPIPKPIEPKLKIVEKPAASVPAPIVIPPATVRAEIIRPYSPTAEMEGLLPVQLFFDNDKPGENSNKKVTHLQYGQTYYGYKQNFNTFLDEHRKKSGNSTDIEAFLLNEVDYGYKQLMVLCGLLKRALNDGHQIELTVRGYTSPRAKTDYNANLSSRRISSVKNFFETYHMRSFMNSINSGALRITEIPLGETTAPQQINDELENQFESIYAVDPSRERRVEIVGVRLIQ